MIGRCEQDASPKPFCYSQIFLIKKINSYLRLVGRHVLSEGGCCHGLTLYWQQKMSERKEQHFYDLIKKMVESPEEKLKEWQDDAGIQELIKEMRYAQYPDIYDAKIRQVDVDLIMKTDPELFFRDWISLESFVKLIEQYAVNRPCITVANFESMHTIGIYCRDDSYYLYDSNGETGVAVQYDIVAEAAYEMANSLFFSFGVKFIQWTNKLGVIFTNPVPFTSFVNKDSSSVSKNSCSFFKSGKPAETMLSKTESMAYRI
jgi:hypothetical protein